eukprot:377578-Rhodomonas_salina.2
MEHRFGISSAKARFTLELQCALIFVDRRELLRLTATHVSWCSDWLVWRAPLCFTNIWTPIFHSSLTT